MASLLVSTRAMTNGLHINSGNLRPVKNAFRDRELTTRKMGLLEDSTLVPGIWAKRERFFVWYLTVAFRNRTKSVLSRLF